MSIKREYSRLITKRTAQPGVVPTMPGTSSTTDFSDDWLSTDIYEGEMFVNLADDKIFFRSANGIFELQTGSASVGTASTYNLQNITDNGSVAYLTSDVLFQTSGNISLNSDNEIKIGTGTNSSYSSVVNNSVIIGGDNLTATQSNTLYVQNIHIDGTMSGVTIPTPSLEDVLLTGNQTNGTSIELSNGDILKAVNGDSRLDLRAYGANDSFLLSTKGSLEYGSVYANNNYVGIYFSDAAETDFNYIEAGDDYSIIASTRNHINQIQLNSSSTGTGVLNNGIFIESKTGDIKIDGNEMYINTGSSSTYTSSVTNSVIIGGDNLTATQSNTLYTDNMNIKGDLFLGTSSTIHNFNVDVDLYEDITYSDLTTLQSNSDLEINKLYHITDRRIFITALSDSTFSVDCDRIMACVLNVHYTPHTVSGTYDIEYLGIYGQTIAQGAVPVSRFSTKYRAIWGSKMWERDTSGADGGSSDFKTISSGWTLVSELDTDVYEDKEFKIKYEFSSDYISSQTDWKGNTIIDVNSYDGIDYSDWGNEDIRDNVVTRYIVNNYVAPSSPAWIFNNKVFKVSASTGIINNTSGVNISNNEVYGIIQNNSNVGGIRDNFCGNDISGNSNNGGINDNIIKTSISGNSCLGITNNTVKGIVSNSNLFTINNNFGDGGIGNNGSNVTTIAYNIIREDIRNNDNSGVIQNNIITLINNNTNSGNIINNVCINISDNSSGSFISDNVVPNITDNSQLGIIHNNRNNGDISENSSQGVTVFHIRNNMNNGFISNNESSATINIENNMNNGYIGDSVSTVVRASSVSDNIINK